MYLFDLVSRHMTWLSERQSVIASNIANADTPGYRAREIAPFSEVLDGGALHLATTSRGHLVAQENLVQRHGTIAGASWGSSHSGNNVSIERELMQASSTSRMMNIDSTVARAFHRMLLSSLKG